MADVKQRFCPRCGKPGNLMDAPGREVYICPGGQHGVIWNAPLPAQEPQGAVAPGADVVAQAAAPAKQPKALN
jgi:hypothetical protein